MKSADFTPRHSLVKSADFISTAVSSRFATARFRADGYTRGRAVSFGYTRHTERYAALCVFTSDTLTLSTLTRRAQSTARRTSCAHDKCAHGSWSHKIGPCVHMHHACATVTLTPRCSLLRARSRGCARRDSSRRRGATRRWERAGGGARSVRARVRHGCAAGKDESVSSKHEGRCRGALARRTAHVE